MQISGSGNAAMGKKNEEKENNYSSTSTYASSGQGPQQLRNCHAERLQIGHA